MNKKGCTASEACITEATGAEAMKNETMKPNRLSSPVFWGVVATVLSLLFCSFVIGMQTPLACYVTTACPADMSSFLNTLPSNRDLLLAMMVVVLLMWIAIAIFNQSRSFIRHREELTAMHGEFGKLREVLDYLATAAVNQSRTAVEQAKVLKAEHDMRLNSKANEVIGELIELLIGKFSIASDRFYFDQPDNANQTFMLYNEGDFTRLTDPILKSAFLASEIESRIDVFEEICKLQRPARISQLPSLLSDLTFLYDYKNRIKAASINLDEAGKIRTERSRIRQLVESCIVLGEMISDLDTQERR